MTCFVNLFYGPEDLHPSSRCHKTPETAVEEAEGRRLTYATTLTETGAVDLFPEIYERARGRKEQRDHEIVESALLHF